MKSIIVAHCGAGSPKSYSDGPKKATRVALQALKLTNSVLKAAVRGTMLLEDDVRFDAGTGSYLRIDGKTIEMDASVMDSYGNFGAVACIKMVKNPVLVAELVSRTPHLLLCGDGAVKFARQNHIPVYNPITPKAVKYFKCVQKQIIHKKDSCGAEQKSRLSDQVSKSGTCSDTVGIVVSDGRGNFAAANSTGGIPYMLLGRVGDTPLIGCGIYVGKKGAVVATGLGEEITRRFLSKQVYDKIDHGMNPQSACEWGLTLFNQSDKDIKKKIPVGLIAVNKTDFGIAVTHQMGVGVTSCTHLK